MLDPRLLRETPKKHGAVLERSEIDAAINQLRTPDGVPFRQSLKQRNEALRKHWEQKGYRFFEVERGV